MNIKFIPQVVDLLASEYHWTYHYICNLSLHGTLDLLVLIKERNLNTMIENIQILSTVLMAPKDKTTLVDDLHNRSIFMQDEDSTTDFTALDKLKTETQGGD